MKSLIIGRKHDPLKFTLQAVGLQYFDKEKNKFVMIELYPLFLTSSNTFDNDVMAKSALS